MSSDDEFSTEDLQNDDLQLTFVTILEDFKIVLDKSLTPSNKSAKEAALKELLYYYNKNTRHNLDLKQIKKKINNMKSKVKRLTDLKKTGNKKIKLNEWQQKFYNLWNGDENPVIQKVPGKYQSSTTSLP